MALDTSKIIHAPVGGGRYTVTAPIVKEDYGLYLKIEGLELPSTYEVDFSNSENSGTSVTMIGNADGVLIPSQFISSGKDVFAFLYHVGEDYGRTVFKFRIPNKLRPDRTDEQPTPEEQSVIDQAISALNSAVEQTAQDKADADVSAQNASADAERAEEARTDAQNYASSANTSSDAAYRSASSAQLFASQAETSAQSAEQSAERAEQARDTAEGFASVASTNASESAQSAVNALTSARMAEDAKTSAQTSAQTASAKASEASTSASTASTKASESAQSASQALTYKTDAESAKTSAQTAQGLAESARDDAISAKTDAESARDEAQSIADGISGKVEQIDSNTERIESLEDDRYKPYPTDTASGAIASFTDGADGIPLKSLVVDINPVQDLSQGDPSPENICPISGWTGVNVTRTGKNLWRFDNTYSADASGSFIPIDDTREFALKAGTYTWSFTVLVPLDTIQIYLKTSSGVKKAVTFYIGKQNGTGRKSYTFALDEDVAFLWSAFCNTEFSITDIQIETGSSATTYEPYQGQTYDITFPSEAGTVYGGTLDVVTGVLTVDRGLVTLKGTERWDAYPSYEGYQHRIPSMKYGARQAGHSNMLVPAYTSASGQKNTMWLGVNTNIFYAIGVYETMGNTLESFKSFLAANNLQVEYPLGNPVTYQLTPVEVATVLGENNIFADTGDSAVEYRADTKLYIEKLTQPEEDDMVADSAITSGKFFMVGNTLYRALTNIASGATITVGTNAQRVSLADALNLVTA